MLHINHISSKDVHILDYDDIIDVRSPSEFVEDHLPGAINLPVLSNLEREEVGTIYKQVNPFEARRRGAALVSYNISEHLKDYFFDKKKDFLGWIRLGFRWSNRCYYRLFTGWNEWIIKLLKWFLRFKNLPSNSTWRLHCFAFSAAWGCDEGWW